MNLKFRNILLPMMAGAIAFSCDKNDSNEVNPEASLTSEATQNASSNIIYNETFEGSTVWAGLHKQFGTSHAFNVASSPALEGSKSGRFELRDSDPIQSGGTRSEVLFPEQSSLNRWYGFSVYHPAADYAKDSYTEIINQWHQGGGKSPSISLEIKDDRYYIVIPSDASGSGSTERINVAPVTKDKWNRFAFHINHATDSKGKLEIWLNGSKILDRSGSNMYSGASSPRWKVGIYKWKWNDNMTTDTKKRVLYFDNVKIGDQNATLADMTTGGSTTSPTQPAPAPAPVEPAPAPAPTPTAPVETAPVETAPAPTAPSTSTGLSISSFTLVDASRDRDVMTFTNGATLDLTKLGVTKFTVRANTSPANIGSVKFELGGVYSRNYTDSQFPYAVQGDDGAGNYYFGQWELPTAAGSYTLKATPYSGSNAGGTAGATTTVSFTVR